MKKKHFYTITYKDGSQFFIDINEIAAMRYCGRTDKTEIQMKGASVSFEVYTNVVESVREILNKET